MSCAGTNPVWWRIRVGWTRCFWHTSPTRCLPAGCSPCSPTRRVCRAANWPRPAKSPRRTVSRYGLSTRGSLPIRTTPKTRSTAATTASMNCSPGSSRLRSRAVSRYWPTAKTPATSATTGPVPRRPSSSKCAPRSRRPAWPRGTFAPSPTGLAYPPLTSRRCRVSAPASRTARRSRRRNWR